MASDDSDTWTLEQEECAICMWEMNQCLYNPVLKEYRCKQTKKEVYLSIAEAVGRPESDVRTKLSSLADQYTRYRKGPPKTSSAPRNSRRNYLLEKLDFLAPFRKAPITDTFSSPEVTKNDEMQELYCKTEASPPGNELTNTTPKRKLSGQPTDTATTPSIAKKSYCEDGSTDDDALFVSFVAAELKNLSPQVRRLAKMKIHMILYQCQTENGASMDPSAMFMSLPPVNAQFRPTCITGATPQTTTAVATESNVE